MLNARVTGVVETPEEPEMVAMKKKEVQTVTAAELPATRLFLDRTYGREIDTAFVDKIVKEFDWNLFTNIIVSNREDGTYAVIDGNHRLAAAVKVFGPNVMVPVIVMQGLRPAQEAEYFYDYHTKRRAPTIVDKYHAQLAAKNTGAVSLDKVLTARGLKVLGRDTKSMAPKVVAALSAIRAMQRENVMRLERTLDILLEAWADDMGGFQALPLKSVWRFLKTYEKDEKFDRAKLVTAMKEHTPAQLIRLANSFADTMPGGTNVGTFGARGLVQWHNAKSRTKKLNMLALG